MFGNEFYIKHKKAPFIKDGFFKLVFIKIKNSTVQKTLLRE